MNGQHLSGVIQAAAIVLLVLAAAIGSGCRVAGVSGGDDFGMVGEQMTSRYTLSNNAGMRIVVSNLGATLVECHVPDAKGQTVDVVLGHDFAEPYTADGRPYFGATIGRVANRIADGRFELNGRTYQLATNNGPNHLHGGIRGFDQYVWRTQRVRDDRGPAIEFRMTSRDGDEGYPGELDVVTRYVLLADENTLIIEFEATTDADTIVNLCNHAYWNLSGAASGAILEHEVRLNADFFTPVDNTLIPTGEIRPVAGTPMDLRVRTRLGEALERVKAADPANPNAGFDHNFVVNGTPRETFPGTPALRQVATVIEPGLGRVMEVFSDQPGVQFYTGNFLDGTVTGKGGVYYRQHAGLCLETQKFPDAINHRGKRLWPDVVLRPDGEYRHTVVHRFSTTAE